MFKSAPQIRGFSTFAGGLGTYPLRMWRADCICIWSYLSYIHINRTLFMRQSTTKGEEGLRVLTPSGKEKNYYNYVTVLTLIAE